jgi:hypothetical protein
MRVMALANGSPDVRLVLLPIAIFYSVNLPFLDTAGPNKRYSH